MQEPASPADLVRPLIRTRQVREFTADPVRDEALAAIADAGRWSGSSRNGQPWRFIVIRRSETIRALAELGAPQTRALATATAAIAIAMPVEKGSAVSHAFDEGRAAERMLVAASLLGLGAGIAWLVPDARGPAGELVGLPEDRSVRTVIAIGQPTAGARRPKSRAGEARLPRDEVVFDERWPEPTRPGR